jgi:hydroxymethylglutaryl-CoA synthase
MARYALAVGMDTAQGRPGDALEYTAAAGGAAFLLGPADESLVEIEASYSYATDTPDFWRRANEKYPEHGERFTGEPAYFHHSTAAANGLMEALGTTPADYQYAVFHQPNAKFPQRVAATLGFSKEQIETGLLVPLIGNVYAGSSLIGLSAIMDEAQPGDRILLVSYGSGAGSDAVSLRASERLPDRQGLAPRTQEYIQRRTEIDYATYARFRDKLTLK